MIYNVEVEIEGENGAPLQQQQNRQAAALEYSGGTAEDQPNVYGEGGEALAEEPVAVQQRRVDANEQLGRNDPCWCGSGKKFKKCHGA